MTLVADVFWQFQTVKNVVRSMSKKSRFRKPFDKQDGKQSQTLKNLQDSNLIVFIDPCETN